MAGVGDAALDSQAVLRHITDDGTFDKLRQKALQELRQHKGLREKAEELVAKSKAFRSQDKDQGNRKKLFDSIKRELEERMLEEATKAMWQVITDEGYGISPQIEATVQETLCRMWGERQQQQQQQQGSAAPAQQPAQLGAPPFASGGGLR